MPKNIIFLHPDLGVGGAERLVVDAAVALKEKGYNVSFITSYHNYEHCFEETKNGTLKVTVVGNWIPRNLLGRFYALLSYLKMIYCALYICFFETPDIVFCDLIPVCIPILHFSVKIVIYYCHYPDQLLSKQEGILKKIYRLPLNWLEERTIGCADKIYVNSEFTKSVYKTTFKSLSRMPSALYPSINTGAVDDIPISDDLPVQLKKDNFIFLTINRFERKKHIELAINALVLLQKKLKAEDWDNISLVVAGGYDPRVEENVEYFIDLMKLTDSHNLGNKIFFLKSPSDRDKINLLRRSDCLIYTPPNEHFGIVPLEAMYCKKPVIACNTGGPTETILDWNTGILCDFTVENFSEAMVTLVKDRKLCIEMGNRGYDRFLNCFSFATFSDRLNADIEEMLRNS